MLLLLLPSELLELLCKFVGGYSYVLPIECEYKANKKKYLKTICKNKDLKSLAKFSFCNENSKYDGTSVKFLNLMYTLLYDTNDRQCITYANQMYEFISNLDTDKFVSDIISLGLCNKISGKCEINNWPVHYFYDNSFLRRAIKYRNIEALKIYEERFPNVFEDQAYTYICRYKITEIPTTNLTQEINILDWKIYNREMLERVNNSEYDFKSVKWVIPRDCLDILLEMDFHSAIDILINKLEDNFDIFREFLINYEFSDETIQYYKRINSFKFNKLNKNIIKKLLNTEIWKLIPEVCYANKEFRKYKLEERFNREETIQFLDITFKLIEYPKDSELDIKNEDWKELSLEYEDLVKYNKKISLKCWKFFKEKEELRKEEYISILNFLS